MSIRHALRAFVVLSLLGPAWAEDVRAQSAFTLKYGNGDAQVGRDTDPGTAREWTGPSSIRLGADGELLVADPINHRVHRLTPNGQPKEVVTLPASTRSDAEVTAIDAAVDRDGAVAVLELASRSVMRFAGSKTLESWIVPANAEGGSIFNALVADSQKDLWVFDGANDRAIRFDARGKTTETKPGVVHALTMDGAGKFVALDLPDGGSAKKFSLTRVDGATGKTDAPVHVTLAEPVNQAHLLGLDDAGRAYLEVTFGAIEKPDRRQVLVVSAEGKILEGIPVPTPPTEFKMVSARVVLPGGGFLTATDTPQGLEIRRHGLAR